MNTDSVPLPMVESTRSPERRLLLQLVAGFALYVVCQLVVTVVTIGVYATTVSTAEGAETSLTVGEILTAPGPAAPAGFAAGAVVAVIGFIVIVRWLSRRRATEFGRSGSLREIGWGLIIGLGVIAAAVGLLGALGVYRIEAVQLPGGVITALMIGVGPAVVEEVFFRGILLRVLDNWLGSWPALAIVSVVFALVHSFSSPAGPIAAVYILISASLLLNVAFFLTRRLWLPIALHLAFNAAQSAVFGLNVSGTTAGEPVIVASLSGPTLLTGGQMGGEGSVIVIAVALAAGTAMTIHAVRRGAMLPRTARLR